MNRLVDSDSGEWLVATASGSTYVLNLDARTIRRTADCAELDRLLRRDGEAIHLMGLVRCEVGHRMHLCLDLLVAGVDYTTRLSTRVIAIRSLTDKPSKL